MKTKTQRQAETQKPRLVIISDWIRRDLHEPLRHFKRVEVIHLYQTEGYHDMRPEDYTATPARRWHSIAELWQALVEIHPTIVQGAEPWAGWTALKISFVSYWYKLRYPAVRLIWPAVENRPLARKFSWWKRLLLSWWARQYATHSDRIITLNNGAETMLKRLQIPEEKLVRLLWGTWGIDCREFSPQSKSKVNLPRRQAGSQPASPAGGKSKGARVLFVGRVARAKGLPWILEAWPTIQMQFPSTELVIGGPCNEPELIEEITKIGATWTGGPVKNHDLPALFRTADVVVAPSITTRAWEEQIGMINLQAMACGVPIVTTTSGAIPEYVQGGEGALLVPEQNSQAIAAAVIRIFKLPHRQQFGQRGRTFVCHRYEVRRNIKQLETFLHGLTDSLKKRQEGGVG
ncbi:glycosyltransferase family 4 protein [Candidatus Berkelbacteria bacterium]|nr:glycosyltransferase family 4 protein [Candidatus Berkelbacteria bacterium]